MGTIMEIKYYICFLFLMVRVEWRMLSVQLLRNEMLIGKHSMTFLSCHFLEMKICIILRQDVLILGRVIIGYLHSKGI